LPDSCGVERWGWLRRISEITIAAPLDVASISGLGWQSAVCGYDYRKHA
jgi:hypothetical protein